MNALRTERLSMGNIDEISLALGAIQSDLTNIKTDGSETRNLIAAVSGQLTSMNTSHVIMQTKIDAAHARLDKAEPKIERHDTIIGRVIWLGGIIIAGITLVFNWVSPWIAKIFP